MASFRVKGKGDEDDGREARFEKLPALVFTFPCGKRKARSAGPKLHTAEKGIKMQFWGLTEALRLAPKVVWIVEGELDRCALVEAGFEPGEVISVPNGAKEPTEATKDLPPEQRGLGYVREALEQGLNKVRQFVFAGDTDDVGSALKEDLAKIFGPARYNFVTWPEGCKDANDYLRSDGAEALRDMALNGFLPWPVDGLFRMSDLPEPPALVRWDTGFGDWEGQFYLAPRTLSVVTGHPGHGKTVLWSQIWHNVVREYDVPMALATFETEAKPHYRRLLRTFLNGMREEYITDDMRRRADAWIDDRYHFMVSPNRRATLSWFLGLAEVAVIRHGARIIQIDPFNRLESERPPGMSETEYIGQCLIACDSFAKDMNCHVQILAHPAKSDAKARGQAPVLEDISGSKNWDNMVDMGAVVHRSKFFENGKRVTTCDLIIRKQRFDALGYPCTLPMDFDLRTGCYRTVNE